MHYAREAFACLKHAQQLDGWLLLKAPSGLKAGCF